MKKKTYLLMALTLVSMGMNAQNSGSSSLEKGIGEFTKSMTIGGTIRSKYEYQTVSASSGVRTWFTSLTEW